MGVFFLNEENKKTGLYEVVRCIDGADVFTQCILGLPKCSADNPCSLHEEAERFKSQMLMRLKRESIAEAATRIQQEKMEI